ncbi:MAG: hypothetical protein MAGBODY4_00459 [Candidatus Marinimicrobia bacterium]|nr:hypothetical protein [Candidatus Neomarinimicrobiota bacterium]
MRTNIVKIVILWLALPLMAIGQKLDPDITINAERLDPTKQAVIQTLERDITDYISTYDYTDDTYGTVIPLVMRIHIQQASETNSNIIFNAQILVTNGTDQRYFDTSWEFPYNSGLVFRHNVYNPLTGVIDFYCYIVLAGEVDTYGKLAGTPYYNAANEIANQARGSSYNTGWRNRIQRLDDLQNHRDLRLLKYTFFDAYWDYQESNIKDAKIGFKDAMDLLKKILNHNREDKYTKIFLDGQAKNFAWLAAKLKDAKALQALANLDPDNEETYQSYLQ